MAESYRLLMPPNLESAGKYYTEVVRNYPLSTRAKQAKDQLERLNLPVPQPNPIALTPRDTQNERGFFGTMFGFLKGHPAVPTDTNATSVRDEDKDSKKEDKTKDNTNSGNGNFSVAPKVNNK
jgi:hypothetical protein